MIKKIKTIYLGTPDFSIPALEMLLENPFIDLLHVVTMPSRPAGRGKKITPPAVAQFAIDHKIPFLQTQNINKEEYFINNTLKKADIVIVLAFAQFLGKKILEAPRKGCFNIHTSLLPKYRGAAPIQYALLNDDKKTGVTIQKMVKKMDAGDIVFSAELPINSSETGGQLYTRLKFQAALSLNQFIEKLIQDKIISKPQNEKEVTFAPTLKKEDGHIDFKNSTMRSIQNQIRALDPWPGTWCTLNNKRLKVFTVIPGQKSLSPGKISINQTEIHIGVQDGSLRLAQIQLEGKKRCTDSELINGLQNIKEEISIK